jgi:O-antigen/teichoic acid export membrane protein
MIGAQVARAILARDSAFLTTTVSTLLVILVSGVFGVLSTRALGPYQRGILATAVVWTSILASIVAVGIPQAITYYVGKGRLAASYASTGLIMAFAAGSTLAVVGAAVALAFAPNDANVPMAILFVVVLPLIVAGVGLGAILGTGAYRKWGLLRVINPCCALLVLVVILVAGGDTAVGVAVAMAVATIVQSIVVLWAMSRLGLLGRPRRSTVGDLLSYGGRQVISGAAWLLNYKLDQLVLSVVVAPASLGLYAAASSFGELIAPIAASTGSVMLVRTAAGGTREAAASLRRAVSFCSAVAVGMALFTALFGGQLLQLLFGDSFLPALEVLRILLIGTVGLAVAAVLGDTLRGLGYPLDPAKAEVAGVCVTVAMLAALVPSQGIRGAAIASAVSYNFVMVVMALLLRSRMRHGATV